jgi:hypothetical protein
MCVKRRVDITCYMREKQLNVPNNSAKFWAIVLFYVGLNPIDNSFKCRTLLHSDRVLTLVFGLLVNCCLR